MVHPRFAEATAFGRRALGYGRGRLGLVPGPDPDPTGFYAAVDPGPGRRGEVLGAEPMSVGDVGTGWRVRYRTLDAAGRPVAASLALAVPAGLAPTPRPVVVSVHGARGVAPGCGPSRVGLEAWYPAELVAAGAVVVAPDLTGLGMEGPIHPYLHGTTAGRSVLDAARAAAGLTAAGAGNVVVLSGHSAGGHAVLWANRLAAGDDGAGLDVRLAVAASPLTDLAVAMRHYAGIRSQVAYPLLLTVTWPDVEPVDAAAVLTPAAMERAELVRSQCLWRLQYAFRGRPSRWLRPEGFAEDAWATALAQQSAPRSPGAAPVLLVHGDADEPVPVGWSERYAADVSNVELCTYPGVDHSTIHDAARDDVLRRILAAIDR